jgi:hypothetical protein
MRPEPSKMHPGPLVFALFSSKMGSLCPKSAFLGLQRRFFHALGHTNTLSGAIPVADCGIQVGFIGTNTPRICSECLLPGFLPKAATINLAESDFFPAQGH